MSVFSKGAIRLAVTSAVERTAGRPFTLADIASATGLTAGQIFGVVRHMQLAGLVAVVGERREAGKPGRGVRLYAAARASLEAAGPSPAAKPAPGGERPRAALLERVRAVVAQFSDRFDFTAADVAGSAGSHREPIRWALAALEREGAIQPLIEIRPSEVVGRPARRWTSNPTNMATQSHLERKLREIEDGELR